MSGNGCVYQDLALIQVALSQTMGRLCTKKNLVRALYSGGGGCTLSVGTGFKLEIRRTLRNSLRNNEERDVSKSIKSISALLFFLLAFSSVTSAIAAAKTGQSPDARSGFVTSWDGAKIHYLAAGKISASGTHQPTSVLFVPGFTMPAWIWENQIAHFSTDYRVVAMDLRSQGDSSKTGEGDYPASHGRDINAVIDQLHLAPVVLVGWSMAVTEIASYVDQFGTGSIAGVVLVDGIAGLELTPEVVKSSIEFLKEMQSNRSQQTSDFVRSMFRKPQSEEYLQKLIKASMATPTDAAVAIGLAGFNTDNRPALAKINKPTLIVGANKRLLPQFQDMQKSIPHAKLEFFDDAGHALFVDDADKFNNLLDEFLRNLNQQNTR
jgi:non-heme chloroperoxidase